MPLTCDMWGNKLVPEYWISPLALFECVSWLTGSDDHLDEIMTVGMRVMQEID